VLELVNWLPRQSKDWLHYSYAVGDELLYTVWVDNYFTSVDLFTRLREMNIGASGTMRAMTARGLDPRLVNLRKDPNDSINWGDLYAVVSPNSKVLQLAWKVRDLYTRYSKTPLLTTM